MFKRSPKRPPLPRPNNCSPTITNTATVPPKKNTDATPAPNPQQSPSLSSSSTHVDADRQVTRGRGRPSVTASKDPAQPSTTNSYPKTHTTRRTSFTNTLLNVNDSLFEKGFDITIDIGDRDSEFEGGTESMTGTPCFNRFCTPKNESDVASIANYETNESVANVVAKAKPEPEPETVEEQDESATLAKILKTRRLSLKSEQAQAHLTAQLTATASVEGILERRRSIRHIYNEGNGDASGSGRARGKSSDNISPSPVVSLSDAMSGLVRSNLIESVSDGGNASQLSLLIPSKPSSVKKVTSDDNSSPVKSRTLSKLSPTTSNTSNDEPDDDNKERGTEVGFELEGLDVFGSPKPSVFRLDFGKLLTHSPSPASVVYNNNSSIAVPDDSGDLAISIPVKSSGIGTLNSPLTTPSPPSSTSPIISKSFPKIKTKTKNMRAKNKDLGGFMDNILDSPNAKINRRHSFSIGDDIKEVVITFDEKEEEIRPPQVFTSDEDKLEHEEEQANKRTDALILANLNTKTLLDVDTQTHFNLMSGVGRRRTISESGRIKWRIECDFGF